MVTALALSFLLSLTPQLRVGAVGTSEFQGQVVDQTTQSPVEGARVWLVELGRTAFTDADGRFSFKGIPGGAYTVTVSQIGYIFVKRRIDVPDGQTLGLVLPLAEGQGTYADDVTVAAETERPSEPGVAAQSTIGSGMLQSLRSVAADDPMRAMQALPGVSTGDDFRSEFSVRGASFRQMGTVIDGVATPLLVHTVKGRDDTGSVAMINTDVLDSASLLIGAQPLRDGNWLGGTLKFTIREGSRDRRQLRLAASDTGAAIVAEGPVGRARKGSWIYSIRKSFADWLIRKIDPKFGSTLGFVDMQSKAAYDLTDRQQVQFMVVAGDANYFQANTSAANGLHTANTRSAVASAAWRYARPSVVASSRVSTAYSDFQNFGLFEQNQGDGRTHALIWRTDVLWTLRPWLIAEGGTHVEALHDDRTLRSYTGSTAANIRLRSTDAYDERRTLSAGWAQITAKSTSAALVGGVRAITKGGDDTVRPAPWILGEWRPVARLQLRAGVSQNLQYPDLYQVFGVHPLTPEYARSFDSGVEWSLPSSMLVRVNGYARQEWNGIRAYNNEARLVAGKLVPATTPTWMNALDGRSRGVEVLLQRKAPTGLVGWVGYAWSHTRYNDTITGESFDSDFDQRHTFNVFVEERLSYRTAVSGKIRYGSNAPIAGYFTGTPPDDLYVGSQRNEVRLPPYLRVDLRANRTYTFDRRRLTLFVEVINATGRRNLGTTEGSVKSSFQATGFTEKLIPVLPSVGVLIEF